MPTDRERDCPKCGDSTTVKGGDDGWPYGGNPLRVCDNDACNWCVVISGRTYA